MDEDDAKAMGIAEWVESYYRNTVSGQYDDLVRRPRRVVAPLVCVEYEEIEGDGGERRSFPIAIPSDTTTCEVRRLLESLPVASDPYAFVIDALSERYEHAREVACDSEAGVGTQLFHNRGYRAVVLVEGTSWCCSLRMAYSHAPAIVSVDSGEDMSIAALLDRLLEGRKMRTSYFEIPLDAFQP